VVWSEIVFGSLLVLLLVGLSVYFGRQQVLSLRKLRNSPDVPDEEMRYERRKAYRRLVSCSLTLVLAGLLAGLLAFYELPTQRIAEGREKLGPGSAPAWTEQERGLIRVWSWTWMAFLLVLMAVLALAGLDLLSTRRYALRQYRKLQADRRAMIERQANRMRRDRNGYGGGIG
jgi:hypothetical protein